MGFGAKNILRSRRMSATSQHTHVTSHALRCTKLAHWKGLASGCFGSFQASARVPLQPRNRLRCPLHPLSGRGRWSFPTCSATPPPSDHLLCQLPKSCPWVENSSQQRSLLVPRLALILQQQLTPSSPSPLLTSWTIPSAFPASFTTRIAYSCLEIV